MTKWTILALSLAILAGCGDGKKTAKPSSPAPKTTQQGPSSPAEPEKTPKKAEPEKAEHKTGQGRGPKLGECSDVFDPVLHCGRGGNSPSLGEGVDCCLQLCQGELKHVDTDAVWVLDGEGKKVPGTVTSDKGCVRFSPQNPMSAGKPHEMVFDRKFATNSEEKQVSIVNAEEGVGRYRFCFDPGEDAARRNNPSNHDNGCEAEKERKARRPALFQTVRYYTVARPDITRVDERNDVQEMISKGLDASTIRPVAEANLSSMPAAAKLVLQDAAHNVVGKGRLDCNGWFCFAGNGGKEECGRVHGGWFNREWHLDSKLCVSVSK